MRQVAFGGQSLRDARIAVLVLQGFVCSPGDELQIPFVLQEVQQSSTVHTPRQCQSPLIGFEIQVMHGSFDGSTKCFTVLCEWPIFGYKAKITAVEILYGPRA